MNEFIEQFLTESRELVDFATDSLLKLEKTPTANDQIDAAFRAFHTLKGGAGIMEFAAMERVVHAAEELLSKARAGEQVLTPSLIGDCLACLDQVVQWLDATEVTGEFPAAAEAQAKALVERLASADAAPVQAPRSGGTSWHEGILGRNPAHREKTATVVRYTPAPDCFFHGLDPLAKIESLPGLLSLEIEAASAWPPLEALDPFACNIIILALTSASEAEVTGHLAGAMAYLETVAISAAQDVKGGELSPAARKVLEAQIALLDGVEKRAFRGIVTSAGVVAANVLKFSGRGDDAVLDAVLDAVERSLREGKAEILQTEISNALSSSTSQVAQAAVPASPQDIGVRTFRIDAARVDALVRLTGELSVAKNAIGHLVKLAQNEGNALAGALKDRHGSLEHLVSELQRSVLAMRVLPLRSVFQRFPRLVREMSASLGKPVRLLLEGEETEADKAIVEMLFEPLLHIIRNAMDHGVEKPAVRASRNKPATATLEMRASRQGDQVVIEINDDGGGVDVARVREVALARGVASPEALAALSDQDAADLIFAAGFSTSATVTEISGRGVGMDAVRSAVERVGGRVTLASEFGQGTTVRFLLPFSVMMTNVMTVEAGGQVFGIPFDAVVETVRVPREAVSGVGGGQAFVLRDRTIPIIELAEALGADVQPSGGGDAIIVVTAVAGGLAGINVDRLGDRMEVMLKPLDGLLAGTTGIAGTTLLGDGRVLLVLDLGGMLQ